MADVKFFRPGSSVAVQQPQGMATQTNVLDITNQQVDTNGNVISTVTTPVIDVSYDATGEPTIEYVGEDLSFGDLNEPDRTANIETSTESYALSGANSDAPGTAINVISWNGDAGTAAADRISLDATTGLVNNAIFHGLANGLNVQNNTANGSAPLDAVGRQQYDVLTVTDTAYDALEMAGNIDANTLYLIREEI